MELGRNSLQNHDPASSPDLSADTMHDAVQQIREYLQDRVGQPVLLVDINTNMANDFRYVHGEGGVLVDEASHLNAGLNLAIPVDYSFFVEASWNPSLPGAITLMNEHPSTSQIDFLNSTVKLGHPGALTSQHHPNRSEQHVVAGEDIVPWIEETFEDPDKNYLFYADLVRIITEAAPHREDNCAALDWLVVEPYITRAIAEYDSYRQVSAVLEHHQEQITRLLEKINRADAEANQSLGVILEDLRGIEQHIPITNGLSPQRITDPVTTVVKEIHEERMRAIEEAQIPFEILAMRAIRTGRG